MFHVLFYVDCYVHVLLYTCTVMYYHVLLCNIVQLIRDGMDYDSNSSPFPMDMLSDVGVFSALQDGLTDAYEVNIICLQPL